MRHHIGLPQTKFDVLPGKSREATLARYQHLRSVAMNLNTKLTRRLSRGIIQEGGKKLGMWEDGALSLDSEDMSSVLMDYCLFNVYRHHRNTIEQYLIDSPPDADSDEMICLRAMQYSNYTVVMVESTDPGYCLSVRDLLSDKQFELTDIGMSRTATRGVVMATRVFHMEDLHVTGGAGLPLGVIPIDNEQTVATFKSGIREILKPNSHGEIDPAELIRASLQAGSGRRMHYEDPSNLPSSSKPRWGSSASSGEEIVHKIPRNALCPCGSGKKYKQCCMKR
jgi:hypothetical protein